MHHWHRRGQQDASDERRGNKDVLGRTLRGLRNCLDEKLLTGVATSLCQTNIDDLLNREWLQKLIDMGVHYTWYHTYRPVGPKPNFALALLILTALMAALFRSLWDSLLVMLVIPVSMAGGIATLRLLGLFGFQALDLLTMIGFIILLGLVVNAAILLVDQARARLDEGASPRDAVYEALTTRARPIVLSTLTAVLGMLPLIFMPGVGAEIYRGLAAVVAGGMTVGTAFTWFLMPALLRLRERQVLAARVTAPAAAASTVQP